MAIHKIATKSGCYATELCSPLPSSSLCGPAVVLFKQPGLLSWYLTTLLKRGKYFQAYSRIYHMSQASCIMHFYGFHMIPYISIHRAPIAAEFDLFAFHLPVPVGRDSTCWVAPQLVLSVSDGKAWQDAIRVATFRVSKWVFLTVAARCGKFSIFWQLLNLLIQLIDHFLITSNSPVLTSPCLLSMHCSALSQQTDFGQGLWSKLIWAVDWWPVYGGSLAILGNPDCTVTCWGTGYPKIL